MKANCSHIVNLDELQVLLFLCSWGTIVTLFMWHDIWAHYVILWLDKILFLCLEVLWSVMRDIDDWNSWVYTFIWIWDADLSMFKLYLSVNLFAYSFPYFSDFFHQFVSDTINTWYYDLEGVFACKKNIMRGKRKVTVVSSSWRTMW